MNVSIHSMILKYDSSRNFYYQIDNIIMPDCNIGFVKFYQTTNTLQDIVRYGDNVFKKNKRKMMFTIDTNLSILSLITEEQRSTVYSTSSRHLLSCLSCQNQLHNVFSL